MNPPERSVSLVRNLREAVRGRRGRAGGSVTGWCEYFLSGRIHAADLYECRHLDGGRITIHVADQFSRESLTALANKIRVLLALVVDDGSHASAHQQLTLAALLPFFSP